MSFNFAFEGVLTLAFEDAFHHTSVGVRIGHFEDWEGPPWPDAWVLGGPECRVLDSPTYRVQRLIKIRNASSNVGRLLFDMSLDPR